MPAVNVYQSVSFWHGSFSMQITDAIYSLEIVIFKNIFQEIFLINFWRSDNFSSLANVIKPLLHPGIAHEKVEGRLEEKSDLTKL